LSKKLVVLSGESHNAWFNKLTTLAGAAAGFEFAGTSVTAPGFESAGLGGLASSLDGSVLGASAVGAGLGLIDDLNYAETQSRGFLMLTVTNNDVKGEYVFLDAIQKANYVSSVGRTIAVTSAGNASYA
jgi:alkaline phosphatase D